MAHSPTPTDPTSSTQHPPTRTHLMVTRAQVGTVKPNPHFNFHTSHIFPLPKSQSIALSDPNWLVAMFDKYNALVKNSTWMLVSKPPNANVVGIDCDDTFSPVVKPATIRTVLSLALSRGWPVNQLDVKNTFLNGDLLETVYMYQTLSHGTEVAYLLIYVDDIVLTASFTTLLQRIISSLHQEFEMTDLGALNYFLGTSVTRDATGMFLSQRKYAIELLEQPYMVSCNPSRTHVDTKSKLGPDGDPI
ncbi:ribonuclease H-like domain-containing protein [Tanacetum coccineum]